MSTSDDTNKTELIRSGAILGDHASALGIYRTEFATPHSMSRPPSRRPA